MTTVDAVSLEGALVLLVDDTDTNLDLLDMIFNAEKAKTLRAENGVEALELVNRHKTKIDLVISDIRMPKMDGITLTAEIRKAVGQHLPIILLTADYKSEDQLRAGLDSGANDYLNKPLNEVELLARSRSMIRLKRSFDENARLQKHLELKVVERTVEIEETRDLAMFGFAKLAEYRDPETGGHLERIREYTRALTVQLGRDPSYRVQMDQNFILNIYKASPLHDIGKVGIPDNILLKPGPLTPEEFEVMKKHSIIGGRTLQESENRMKSGHSFLWMAREIAYCHHEKWDGSGYPYNIKGESIPLAARIMALADVYDALRSKRAYKDALPHDKAHRILLEGAGTHFDPNIVRAYKEIEDEFVRTKERFHD